MGFLQGNNNNNKAHRRHHHRQHQNSIAGVVRFAKTKRTRQEQKKKKKPNKPFLPSTRKRNNHKNNKGFGGIHNTKDDVPVLNFGVSPPRYANILDWLEGLEDGADGSASNVRNVELKKSSCGHGVGVFATKPIQQGQIVFCVQSEAFVSVSSALVHPVLGPAFRQLWLDTKEDDPLGTSVLAGLVAHLQLNNNRNNNNSSSNDDDNDDPSVHKDFFSTYLDMLPQQSSTEMHALWWNDAEIDLLSKTSGFTEWKEMRADVEEMSQRLCSSVLATDVVQHGEDAVAAAVRAAFVAVLSRSYGVYSSDGREYKTLIPLLDALNHATCPNVQYSFEGLASETEMTGVLVARSLRSLQHGEELTISYGDHPDFIFGLYYGFVLPPSSITDDEKEENNDYGASAWPVMADATTTTTGVMSAEEHVRPSCESMARALMLSDART